MKGTLSGRLVRRLFLQLLPIQLISALLIAVNSFVDVTVIGHVLEEEAMAAAALCNPLFAMIDLSYVLIIGVQIICSTLLGKGDQRGASGLFTSALLALLALGLCMTIAFGLGSDTLAVWLGAEGSAVPLVSDYIRGSALGFCCQILLIFLFGFLPINNRNRVSYFAIGLLITTNLVLNLVFCLSFDMGIFGIGLATSISYLLCVVLLLPSFIGSGKVIAIQPAMARMGQLPRAVMMGMPELIYALGSVLKFHFLNRVLLSTGGSDALVAMTILNSVCAALEAITTSIVSAVTILFGIYYGEEDRESLRQLMSYAMKFSAVLCVSVAALLMLGSEIVLLVFLNESASAWEVSRRMLLLFSPYVILNVFLNLLLQSSQNQGKIGFVSLLSVFEACVVVLISAVGAGVLGTDAVWLSFPASQGLCLLLLAVPILFRRKRSLCSLDAWMNLQDGMGVEEQDRMAISVNSMEGVVNLSRGIVDFCKSRGVDNRRSNLAGLCIEEMASNIVQYGFTDGKQHSIDIRVSRRESGLTIRIRDDCAKFDPTAYLSQLNNDDPQRNVGLRIVVGMAEDVVYFNNIGMNVLLIRI